MSVIEEFLQHLSTKPWNQYGPADYTLQQWHNACLIHNHAGTADYSKGDCKLPVRTPGGSLNKYGVIAAAAVLDGARAPIDATSDQKKTAAKTLVRLFGEVGSQPPKALVELAHMNTTLEDFLEHYGVKGQRWGIRRGKGKAGESHGKPTKPKAHELTDEELKKAVGRMQMERQYNQLINGHKPKASVAKFIAKHATAIVGTAATAVATAQVKSALDKSTKSAVAKAAAKKAANKATS